MDIILSKPRGFCAGVDRAIQIVEEAIAVYNTPIYVRHEIVHNKSVVDRLKGLGAIFVEEVSEVPENSTVIFSAHGTATSVYNDAEKRNLRILDAACPLVKKVHKSVVRHHSKDVTIILIGHSGHPEVVGTTGQLPEGEVTIVGSVADVSTLSFTQDQPLAYTTQTTLSVDESIDIITALKKRYPQIQGPESGDLCYATTNRQAAIKEICQEIDILLVVGATNSSNSNRLRELGEKLGIDSYLIADETSLEFDWFHGKKQIGITSGASAPEYIVQQVIESLKSHCTIDSISERVTMEEKVKFSLPSELKKK
ncbi:MAG: 4-hydroxy-3-methylbut-2-enyl diphosphate reductase [Fibrobacterales bacterium]